MNRKKIILITIASISIVCFCAFVAVILSSRNSNLKPPTSAPVSSTINPDNIIDIEEEEMKDFDYAIITSTDTVELRNNLNERKVLTLERKNWMDIKWSVDNKYISVLSKIKDNAYDLNIYDFNRKTLNKLTDFSNSTNGILSYEWISNNEVLFTQGENPDLWLHKLNVESGEIRKLVRVNSVISSVSPDYKYVVFKEKLSNNNNLIYFLDTTDGSEIYKLSEIEGEGESMLVNDIFFSKNTDKLVFQVVNDYIKTDFGSTTGVIVKNFAPAFPLCSVNADEFIGLLKAENNLKIFNINIKEDELTLIESSSIKKNFTIDIDKSECIQDDNVLLALNIDTDINWYSIENKELTELKFLTDSVEATARN
jgi:hypothetical protein